MRVLTRVFPAIMRLAVVTTMVMPLRAQLDARLATSTDLLDVYRGAGAKPELLTTFDFSGSMHAMYWDPRFWTNADQSSHGSPWGSDDWPGAVLVLDSTAHVFVKRGTGYARSVYDYDQLSYFDPGGGQLVRPDGSLIPFGSGYRQSDLAQLVLQASHVRITCTNGTITRTIDLPIPWTVFQRVSSSRADSIIYTISDTVPAPGANGVQGPPVQVDQVYSAPGAGVENIVNGEHNGYKIGRFHYNFDYLWWIFFGKDARNADGNGSTGTGKYIIPAVSSNAPSAQEPLIPSPANGVWVNGIPAMNRVQGLKYAVTSSWFLNQDKVWWAFRCLDGSEEQKSTLSTNNGNASTTQISRDVRLFRRATSASQADPKLQSFLQAAPATSTPLTYAFANAYAQLVVTPDTQSAFGPQGGSGGTGQSGTGESPVPTCRKTFMVAFTDGIANDGFTDSGDGSALGYGDVYVDKATGLGGEEGTAYGNRVLERQTAALAPGYGSAGLFNIWTLSAVAAHYDKAITGVLSNLAPFKITMRGATPTNPRRIRTMTVGVSLPGAAKDATSGKADLYRAALYGNPDSKTWDLATAPFDPTNPNASDSNVNPFFFDATDPDKLATAMTTIINEVTAVSASISAPSSPLVGLNLGRQAYLGLFQTVKSGPVWQGDLLMAGVRVDSTGISFLQKDGTAAADITGDNAMWSASASLLGKRSWMPGQSNGRMVYTTTSSASTALVRVTDTTSAITNAMVNAASDAERQQILRFMLGAGPSAMVDPTKNTWRTNAMGDIISSSPAALNYPLSMANQSPVLASWLAANASAQDPHFRVIYVADNQGYFHAFGEASGIVNGVPQGAVDELWAFVPYQNLPAFKYLMNASNPHIYMFDGSPYTYFLDQATGGGSSGNGVVDASDTVRIIIGMGKGGRSYFAFDVVNPFSPVLAWTLNPDASTNTVIQRMGLATARPAVGRVETTSSGIKDLLFISGGLSSKEIDTAFSAASTATPPGLGPGTRMGRNIVALDVVNGSLYKVWDLTTGIALTSEPQMGSIAAGVVPFEFLGGSGRTQRLYFMDQPVASASGTPRGSGLWAIGDAQITSLGIRLDSSNIDQWTSTGSSGGTDGLRRVYQAASGAVGSALPTPFNLNGPFPVPRTAPPTISPAAVGVLLGLGDRWDPMDKDILNPAGSNGSGQNRFVLVFDRQDTSILNTNTPAVASADVAGLTDSVLTDLTTVAGLSDTRIQMGGSGFYLNNSYGYYLNLGAGSTTPKSASNKSQGGSAYFYNKILTSPAVLDGVGFFSTFLGSDANGTCAGSGNSKTYRLCNILLPVFNNGTALTNANTFDATAANCSGIVSTFVNIPGDLTNLGTAAVIQSGQGKTTDGTSGTIGNAGAQVAGSFGKKGNLAFRPKTWRIVH